MARKQETVEDHDLSSWVGNVKDEVTKIKREDKQKQRSLVTAAWKANRETIRQRREAREETVPPRLISVPQVCE